MASTVVLVVDDADDIRVIVRRLLVRNGYQVIEADTGLSAVDLARRHRPSLVVIDINLPGIDGIEVARQLRADPALEDVPLLAMTAYMTMSTVAIAHRAGIQRVISKPFDIDTLIEEVTALLPAHHLQREVSS